MTPKFEGGFSNAHDVESEFCADGCLDGCTVLYAGYENEGWEGYAFVLYKDEDGQYMYVEGSHCSCYGLEGQWEPGPAPREMLANKEFYGFGGVKDKILRAIDDD